jgi:hypothetical protein
MAHDLTGFYGHRVPPVSESYEAKIAPRGNSRGRAIKRRVRDLVSNPFLIATLHKKALYLSGLYMRRGQVAAAQRLRTTRLPTEYPAPKEQITPISPFFKSLL